MEQTMKKIPTTTRIHPLMAAAAVSVIVFAAVGTAAVTGLLPSSKAVPAPETALTPAAMPSTSDQMGLQAAAQVPAAAPLALADDGAKPVTTLAPSGAAPARTSTHHPGHHAVHHNAAVQTVAYHPAAPAPAPVAKQPNYVGIGAGALIGGLVGNQIGGGRGKTLATVAGAIGGGIVGNEIANRQQQQEQQR
jgi:uncharacterized protein YcfJ